MKAAHHLQNCSWIQEESERPGVLPRRRRRRRRRRDEEEDEEEEKAEEEEEECELQICRKQV